MNKHLNAQIDCKSDVQTGFALKFWRALKSRDTDLAMREMQTYMAGIPYVEGFRQKLAVAATVYVIE